MNNTILIAGATGDLGGRISHYLVKKGAKVRAIVRENSDVEKINALQKLGVEVVKVDMSDVAAMSLACKDVACVVSALAGLAGVVIDAQKRLLDAAVLAGVPRFIPSDYSLDFTKFTDGENRNLDLRRKFHAYLDTKPIAATTIFNGAFADMLTGQMPLVLFKQKRILYWGDVDHKMQFTTIDNVAEYTANAAIDAQTPRFLWIAGDQVSPKEFKKMMEDITGEPHKFFRPGGLGLLSTFIKIGQFFAPAKDELYPAWQGMQYMRNMIDDRSNLTSLDNNRYEMRWTTAKDVLMAHHAQKMIAQLGFEI
jgi:nucleoside-diphosphate-sugar epimerase